MHTVYRLDPQTRALSAVVKVENRPSGLGWLPDGRLLVVSMRDRRLLRQETDGSLVEHANLHELAAWHCNDMVVDATGRAYVGNFGFDLDAGAKPVPANLALVHPNGRAEIAAPEMRFANGCVVTRK